MVLGSVLVVILAFCPRGLMGLMGPVKSLCGLFRHRAIFPSGPSNPSSPSMPPAPSAVNPLKNPR